MRSKKPLWELDIAPSIYCHWDEKNDGWQVVIKMLNECFRKPTIKSAFRYAQKIADKSGYPIAINAKYTLKRFRSKKPIKCWLVYPKETA